jgi:beta-glucanase (GH16 family)
VSLACFSHGAPAVLLAPAGGSEGSTPTPSTPRRSPRGWRRVFSDEFQAAGALDPAKWGHEIGCVRNDELQYYTGRPENVRAEDGMLRIEARREAYQGCKYTSGSVHTRERFEFRYGRVEVRAKLPAGNGTWSTIWLVGTNVDEVSWPTCGEIDIAEHLGFDPTRIHAAAHMPAYNHVTNNAKRASVLVEKPWETFHVYALEWYPDRIDWYVDEQLFHTFENERTGVRAWPFDAKQYLLINLAIGGSWGGAKGVDDALFPHRFLIDYVRVYEQG